MLNLLYKYSIKQCLLILAICLASINAHADQVKEKETSPPPAEKTIDVTELNKVDLLHQQFSANFFAENLRRSAERLTSYQKVKPLAQSVQEHMTQGRDILAASLIIKNIPMLENNFDNLAIYTFIKILLDMNEWESANKLYDILKNEGDRILASNAAYIFAQYYYERHDSEKVLAELKTTITDLPEKEYHHALLIKGISLQRLKQHRLSLKEYEKIPPTSKHYISARLNMAIANIRQGWWSDGHINLTEALRHPMAKDQEELINRLYLTMGYSFLNQEYFRNSREAFRNVGLNSEYSNRALLGIALTAANQEDYVGALNAVRILKDKKTNDLVVDEANLLMPYFYEKLKQNTTATSGYTEAINYYQGRIAEIQTILNNGISFNAASFKLEPVIELDYGTNRVVLSPPYPEFLIGNYLKLGRYSAYIGKISNDKLVQEHKKLVSAYESTITNMIKSVLLTRIDNLNSYMDQARYGVARLYDDKQVVQ